MALAQSYTKLLGILKNYQEAIARPLFTVILNEVKDL
jgi:hypothetical protein